MRTLTKEAPLRERSPRDEAFETVLTMARENRSKFDSAGRLSKEMVELLRSAGIYRAMVARRLVMRSRRSLRSPEGAWGAWGALSA